MMTLSTDEDAGIYDDDRVFSWGTGEVASQFNLSRTKAVQLHSVTLDLLIFSFLHWVSKHGTGWPLDLCFSALSVNAVHCDPLICVLFWLGQCVSKPLNVIHSASRTLNHAVQSSWKDSRECSGTVKETLQWMHYRCPYSIQEVELLVVFTFDFIWALAPMSSFSGPIGLSNFLSSPPPPPSCWWPYCC